MGRVAYLRKAQISEDEYEQQKAEVETDIEPVLTALSTAKAAVLANVEDTEADLRDVQRQVLAGVSALHLLILNN